MTNKLLKPFLEIEKIDFIVENNHSKSLKIEETETALFALKDNEIVQENEVIDISESTEFKNKIKLKKIEIGLSKADLDYQTVLETSVEYTNGFCYKPSYIESYALLISSGVGPLLIWDSTELNSVTMTIEELAALTTFLKNVAEPAFQTRKNTRKALLEQKYALNN